MCGILGAIHFDGQPVDEIKLKQSSRIMRHRGPDDEGVWVKGNVGFAHQRLSILDLTDAGHQPMVTPDGSELIVYNGECYNFKSLRNDLEAKGYSFRSRTDTEVILYGIREYGPDFIHKVNGMFAFGIWFQKAKELFLFRDRLGIKPLYYYHDADRFYFSSEIKPLLNLGLPVEIEESAVSSFFSLRYSPGEKTLFRNIKKLSAGHYLRISMDGDVRDNTYWSLLDYSELLDISEREAQQKFYDLLNDAVTLRQVADVPVGAFLSGGIDSSAITALMRKNTGDVSTFTFGMGADIDESEQAAKVANSIGVKNTCINLQRGDFQYYEKALWHLEEPLGDSIISPTYLLAKRAAQDVKVVELGEGADEILGGYVHQLAMTYGEKFSHMVPRSVLQSAPNLTRKIPPFVLEKFFRYPAKLGTSGVDRVAKYLSKLDTFGEAYMQLAGVFSEAEKRSIFKEEFYQDNVWGYDPSQMFGKYYNHSRNNTFQNRLLQLDLKYWCADYTMLRMDKLTMAHSLEARVPFLDPRLVELCLLLPREFKTKGYKQKIIFREALAGRNLIPEETRRAPKKSFYLPVEKCFDQGFEEYVRDVLSNETLSRRGILDPEYINALLNSPGRELVFNKQIMLLLSFEIWCKLFLDGGWKDDQAGFSSKQYIKQPQV